MIWSCLADVTVALHSVYIDPLKRLVDLLSSEIMAQSPIGLQVGKPLLKMTCSFHARGWHLQVRTSTYVS